MTKLSGPLELAVRMLANGERLPCYICDAVPDKVDDIPNCTLGHGWTDAEGGMLDIMQEGRAVCLAYHLEETNQIVITLSGMFPCHVRKGQKAKVGPLALGTQHLQQHRTIQ